MYTIIRSEHRSLEHPLIDRNDFVACPIIFLEPAKIFTDKFEEKLVSLEFKSLTISLYLLLLCSPFEHFLRQLSQTGDELTER